MTFLFVILARESVCSVYVAFTPRDRVRTRPEKADSHALMNLFPFPFLFVQVQHVNWHPSLSLPLLHFPSPSRTSMSSTSNRFPTSGVPISAPATPAYTTRSHKPSSEGPPPVTPQRIPRAQRHHHQLQNYFRSPLTPASTLSTPYTPLSLRSSWFSASQSALTTPASATSHKRYNVTASPQIAGYENSFDGQAMAQADTEDSWCSRASENGIRVGSKGDESIMCDEGMS
jgi:hypothetical protein